MTWVVEQLDAVDFLRRRVQTESVDLIVTDPAYESLEKHRAKGTTTRLKQSKSSSNAWFPIFPNSRYPELFAELYRVLKKNSHCYIFCDQETMFIIKPIAEAAGFKFWKPLIWDKMKIGMGYHYRARYEVILFLEKGKRKLNDLGIPDVLSFPRVRGGYPTEKNAELIRLLIIQSTGCYEGAPIRVLDPFCGSGVVLKEAHDLGCDAIGCDISADAIAATLKRLA